jgi:hypothetical protein
MKLGLGIALGAPSFVPSAFDINSLSPELWLKFNEGQGAITDGIQWDDQSGNNRHASQTTDAQEGSGFSGGAFVTDAGSQDNLDLASTFNLTGAYHMFVVLNLSEESNETFVSSVDNSSFIRFAQGGTAANYRMKNGGTTLNITLSGGFGTEKAIAEVSRDGSNNLRVSRNGTVLGSGTGSGTFAFEQIGTSSNGVTSGEIHEVVVFDSLLSTENAADVRNDIADRNNLSI